MQVSRGVEPELFRAGRGRILGGFVQDPYRAVWKLFGETSLVIDLDVGDPKAAVLVAGGRDRFFEEPRDLVAFAPEFGVGKPRHRCFRVRHHSSNSAKKLSNNRGSITSASR